MLDEMNEKEREEEIFKRSEKREMEKKRCGSPNLILP